MRGTRRTTSVGNGSGVNAKRRLLGNFLQLSRPHREKRVEMKVQNGELIRGKDAMTAVMILVSRMA